MDICSIERIKKSATEAFLKKYYTEAEISYLNTKGKFYYDSAAAMFATKEAVLKAFGIGISNIPLNNISLNHNELNAPYVELLDKAKNKFEELNANKIHVSISHEGDMALAFVIIE